MSISKLSSSVGCPSTVQRRGWRGFSDVNAPSTWRLNGNSGPWICLVGRSGGLRLAEGIVKGEEHSAVGTVLFRYYLLGATLLRRAGY